MVIIAIMVMMTIMAMMMRNRDNERGAHNSSRGIDRMNDADDEILNSYVDDEGGDDGDGGDDALSGQNVVGRDVT